MKVTTEKGRKCEGDTILKLETKGEEVITLIDLAYYVNQLGLNELKIIEQNPKLSKEKHFWFENVILKAVDDSKKGIDWRTETKEYLQQLLNPPYFIKNLDKFLDNREEKKDESNTITK